MAWHNEAGQPYPLPHQMIRQLGLQIEQAQRQADQERQRAEQALLENLRLLENLKELGVDLDKLN